MTEKPLVSVIINCYNGEKYLREAIDSVMAQTYENWELVFWDNQSTDSTREIVECYNSPKIRYFYAPEHTPLGEARNKALERVEGELVAFLDCDDIWKPAFLEMGVRFLKKNTNCGAFYSNYTYRGNNGEQPNCEDSEEGIHDLKYIIKKYNIGMSANILDYSIIKTNNIVFNQKYSLIEDLDFFIKIAMKTPFVYCSTPLMYYRRHAQSLSVINRDGFSDELRDLLEDIIKKNKKEKLLSKSDINNLRVKYLLAKMRNQIKYNDRLGMIFLVLSNILLLGRIWKKAIYLLMPSFAYYRLYSMYSKERHME